MQRKWESRETYLIILYFLIYLAYMFFIYLEGEKMHWLSLVIIPLGLIYIFNRQIEKNYDYKDLLASIGLKRGHLSFGIGWAVIAGLSLSILQLAMSRNSGKFLEIVYSGKIIYYFPLAFLLLLFTTGITEEVFFRGILQSRLEKLSRSKWISLLITTLLFGIYHIPYAYLNPNWPSFGDFPYAVRIAMVDGCLGGIIIGLVYIKSRSNLLTAILVHALIDVFPAMTMLKFGGQ